jgi:hypothetical protein
VDVWDDVQQVRESCVRGASCLKKVGMGAVVNVDVGEVIGG